MKQKKVPSLVEGFIHLFRMKLGCTEFPLNSIFFNNLMCPVWTLAWDMLMGNLIFTHKNVSIQYITGRHDAFGREGSFSLNSTWAQAAFNNWMDCFLTFIEKSAYLHKKKPPPVYLYLDANATKIVFPNILCMYLKSAFHYSTLFH